MKDSEPEWSNTKHPDRVLAKWISSIYSHFFRMGYDTKFYTHFSTLVLSSLHINMPLNTCMQRFCCYQQYAPLANVIYIAL